MMKFPIYGKIKFHGSKPPTSVGGYPWIFKKWPFHNPQVVRIYLQSVPVAWPLDAFKLKLSLDDIELSPSHGQA
jgi:hypothetical protein